MAEWKKTPDFRSGRVKKVNFLNEQRERANKGLTGQAISAAFIQPLGLLITRIKNGSNMIIMPQSLKQWNFCLQRKIFHLSFGNVLAVKGICQKCLKNTASRLSAQI